MIESYANLGKYYATLISKKKKASKQNEENNAEKFQETIGFSGDNKEINSNIPRNFYKNSDGNLIYQLQENQTIYPDDSLSNYDPTDNFRTGFQDQNIASAHIGMKQENLPVYQRNYQYEKTNEFNTSRNNIVKDQRTQLLNRNNPNDLANNILDTSLGAKGKINGPQNNQPSKRGIANRIANNLNEELKKMQTEELLKSSDPEFKNNIEYKKQPRENEYYKDDFLNVVKDTSRRNYFTQFLQENAKRKAEELLFSE